eukprot:CAMPEP_0182569304 /NCGR_PEP_ID=MMETSP1324-20130603/9970_1 /TAXON_ID=236786 /ORGANISM="Florenciella sp., Strain RCC1587" /LENGTH=56 /DNA_ID=CAMNT_0024783557 /DNA_START=159 /DNA_END=329 /DNA_ORIENTATION=-
MEFRRFPLKFAFALCNSSAPDSSPAPTPPPPPLSALYCGLTFVSTCIVTPTVSSKL